MVGTTDPRGGFSSWVCLLVRMGGGVEVGLSLCCLGREACLVLKFLLQGFPGVAPGAPYKWLADGERGLGYAPVKVHSHGSVPI